MLKNTKGAGLTEYGLLVGLIAVLAIVSVNTLGLTTRDTFDDVSGTLSDRIGLEQNADSQEAPTAPAIPAFTFNPPANPAVITFSDPINPGSPITDISGDASASVRYINTAAFGYASSGSRALHTDNSTSAAYSGVYSLLIDANSLSSGPGYYAFGIDVGNFNNGPLADFSLGLASADTLITDNLQVLTNTAPGLGQVRNWSSIYYLDAQQIADGITMHITVPFQGISRNVSFDNFTFGPVPE